MATSVVTPAEPREAQEALDALYDRLVGLPQHSAASSSARPSSQDHDSDHDHAGHQLSALGDGAILQRAAEARNGEKFRSLFYDGDTTDYGGDDSAADLALASILAFWTQDRAQIERLFSRSALGQRKKWQDRADYRQRTINRALERTEFHHEAGDRARFKEDGSAHHPDDEDKSDPDGPVADGDGHPLDAVYSFLGRFVAYPSEHARITHTLWIAHTHLMDAWESTPRLAALSPEPASGKTRLLEVTELLVPRPVEAVNVTPAYLFRKVGDDEGRPTILYDEIDTVFGPKARDNEEIRGLLNAGHRRGAVAGRCVVRGKTVLTEEIPAYCAVAMAGLDLPDTILTRSAIIRMRRRAAGERVEPYRRRVHAPAGHEVRDRLAVWALSVSE